MNTKSPFMDELVNIQEPNHYSDSKMAEMMGCSRSLYQATRKGEVGVGIKILQGSLHAFPQLRNAGAIFNQIADRDTDETPPQTILARFMGWLRGLDRGGS